MLKEKILKELKTSDVITSLIGKPNGRFYRCPFHEEHNSSLSVKDDSAYWHCFGCGAGGDLFSFVQRYLGIDFNASLKYIADNFGYNIDDDPYFKNRSIVDVPDYILINNHAWQLFSYQLANDSNCKVAKEYCSNRKLPIEHLGYWNKTSLDLAKFLAFKTGKTPEQVVQVSDLFTRNFSTNKISFTFHNRILIPLFDSTGKNVLGFAGRTLDKNDERKYINPRNREGGYGYRKSSYIYNLNNAKGYNEIIITEGYLDCLSFVSDNMNNVVAIGGVAFTEQQLNKLSAGNKTLILALDNDLAGMEAMFKIQEEHPTYLFKFGLYPLGCKDANDALVSNRLKTEFVITDLYDMLLRLITFYDLTDRKVRVELYAKISNLIDKIDVTNKGTITSAEIKRGILNSILKGGEN